MATKITGGAKTDELLGKNGSGPEGLPHSIIVTPDGIEGEVPIVSTNGAHAAATNGAPVAEEPVAGPQTTGTRKTAKQKSRRPAGRRKR
jgi:DNA topoisomerase-6 subunit B